ncbi:MAG: extracellular solute-binding protein, partial [Alphaproteobacteria bacterium]|nr:extracellular solute-binding protein [Alphaproteobacteria bacterium]
MNTRKLIAGLALGASLFATDAMAQKTEITFARFFGACDSDYGTSVDVEKSRGECGVMTTLVNHFNATNKDNIVVKPQIIEWGPYYQQLTARIAARDIPNIAVMHTSQIGDFIRARIVDPIEDDLKAAGIDINDFTPHAKAGVTFGGKVHALPWDTHSWLWHMNVGMFKQAGLVDSAGKPIIPKSVDELMAQAKTIKEKTGKPYFIMASVASGDAGNGARSFWTMLYTQGGTLFPAGFDKADFNTPEAKNAFEVFERLAKEGYISKGVDGAGAL